MSRNKRTLSLRFAMVFIFSMLLTAGVGTSVVQTADAAKTYKFTMQNMFSLNHPITLAMNQLAKDVKEKSDGRITVQVLPAGALVKGH